MTDSTPGGRRRETRLQTDAGCKISPPGQYCKLQRKSTDASGVGGHKFGVTLTHKDTYIASESPDNGGSSYLGLAVSCNFVGCNYALGVAGP